MLLDISHDSPWHRDSDYNVPHSCTRLNTFDADWSAPNSLHRYSLPAKRKFATSRSSCTERREKNEFNAPFHLALKTDSALTALMRYKPGLFGWCVWVFLALFGFAVLWPFVLVAGSYFLSTPI